MHAHTELERGLISYIAHIQWGDILQTQLFWKTLNIFWDKVWRWINYFNQIRRRVTIGSVNIYLYACRSKSNVYKEKFLHHNVGACVKAMYCGYKLLTYTTRQSDGNTFFFLRGNKSGNKTMKIHLHLYIETNIGFTDQPSLYSCGPHECPLCIYAASV